MVRNAVLHGALAACVTLLATSAAAAAIKDRLKVILIDGNSKHPITRQVVTLLGSGRIECFRAPCPPAPISILWTGHSDRHGAVMIPRHEAEAAASLVVSGYVPQRINADPRFRFLVVQLTQTPPPPTPAQ